MPGHIILQGHITRFTDVRANKEVLYVFGDNMVEQGYGGQAKEMRNEPNAVGIPTKHQPSRLPEAYFSDDMSEAEKTMVIRKIDNAFDRLEQHLQGGGIIVWPYEGVGSGMAQLRHWAPNIWRWIAQRQDILFKMAGKSV